MKTYFRLLSFAKPIEKYAIPFFILSILGVVFGLLNFTLLIPVLEILFDPKKANSSTTAIIIEPNFSFSIEYFKSIFYFYVNRIIDESGKLAALKLVSIIIVVSIILSNTFKYLTMRLVEDFKMHIVVKIRKAAFSNIIHLDQDYFNVERKGSVISKIMNDVAVIQTSIISSMQIILKEPIAIIGFFTALIYISKELTLVALILLPISGLVISFIVKKLKSQAIIAQEKLGYMLSTLDEALHGYKVVKAFNAESYIIDKFQQSSFMASKTARRVARRQLLASPVSEVLGVIAVATLLVYGGSLVLNQQYQLTGPQFIVFIIIFSQILTPAKAISEAFGNIQQGVASGERVLELIDMKSKIEESNDPIFLDEFKSDIEFKNVSFKYHQKPILNHINFKILKGQKIALVGPSGGGKSTIFEIIPRFLDPTEGNILIDKVNLRDLSKNSLRKHMGIVNQDTILFNDSILNNINFGRAFSKDEIIAAAKIANAHDFITNCDDGYETTIGDRGLKLSGGQRQRICIARAVISNPSILLLDEATSALDTESERLVDDALKNLMENRTALVIAHRLSTIQNSDLIIVIDNGNIVESGTHSQLINQNGLYKRLVDIQTFS